MTNKQEPTRGFRIALIVIAGVLGLVLVAFVLVAVFNGTLV